MFKLVTNSEWVDVEDHISLKIRIGRTTRTAAGARVAIDVAAEASLWAAIGPVYRSSTQTGASHRVPLQIPAEGPEASARTTTPVTDPPDEGQALGAVDNAVAPSKPDVTGEASPVPAPEARRAAGVPAAAAAMDARLLLVDIAAMVAPKIAGRVLQAEVALAGVRFIGMVPTAGGAGPRGGRAKARDLVGRTVPKPIKHEEGRSGLMSLPAQCGKRDNLFSVIAPAKSTIMNHCPRVRPGQSGSRPSSNLYSPKPNRFRHGPRWTYARVKRTTTHISGYYWPMSTGRPPFGRGCSRWPYSRNCSTWRPTRRVCGSAGFQSTWKTRHLPSMPHSYCNVSLWWTSRQVSCHRSASATQSRNRLKVPRTRRYIRNRSGCCTYYRH